MKTLLAVLLLSGCALPSGLVMTEAEEKACQTMRCTVWTDVELQALITKAAMIGAQSCRRGTAI